jgi:hypothetical protein
LEQVATQGERTNAVLVETAQAFRATLEITSQTAERLGGLVTIVEGEQAVIAKQLGETVFRLQGDMQPFSAGLKTVLSDLGQMQEQVKLSADESATAHKAAVDVLGSLTRLAREITTVMRTA